MDPVLPDCSHCRFYKTMGFTASLLISYSGSSPHQGCYHHYDVLKQKNKVRMFS